MKCIYKTSGRAYQNQGDYSLPCVKTDESEYHIGIWGQRHRKFLKEHHRMHSPAFSQKKP